MSAEIYEIEKGVTKVYVDEETAKRLEKVKGSDFKTTLTADDIGITQICTSSSGDYVVGHIYQVQKVTVIVEEVETEVIKWVDVTSTGESNDVDGITLTKNGAIWSVKDDGITNDKIKDGEIDLDKMLSTAIAQSVRSQEYAVQTKLTTEKAVIDAIMDYVTKALNIKGSKATEAEILAIINPEEMDAWFCQENSRIYYSKDNVWQWTTFISLEEYVKKTDIVNNLSSSDTDKPLSAKQGKALEDGKIAKTSILSSKNTDADDTQVYSAKYSNSTYLPLAGGTMTGVIKRNGNAMLNTVDNSNLWIGGGTSSSAGAYIQLYGKSSNSGKFFIRATNGSTNSDLVGNTGGNLTWKGQALHNNGLASTAISSYVFPWNNSSYIQVTDAQVKQLSLNVYWCSFLATTKRSFSANAEIAIGSGTQTVNGRSLAGYNILNGVYLDVSGQFHIFNTGSNWYLRTPIAMSSGKSVILNGIMVTG